MYKYLHMFSKPCSLLYVKYIVMSDDSACDSQEEFSTVSPISILAKEIKEDRNKIMAIKKSVTKGDKKQKKVIQDEINVLENELKAKEDELKSLKLKAEIKEKPGDDFEVIKINKVA